MEKNKSIDGLSTRRSKKAPINTVKKSTKPTKTIKINVEKPDPKPTPKPKINATEDFLKPVQVFDFDENSGELKAAKEEPKKQKKSKKIYTKLHKK